MIINNIYTNPRVNKNSYNMINITSKSISFRRACVAGKIYVGKIIFELIKNNKLEKGDVLSLAEIAGINAAKKTSSFILLCHQVNLENIFLNLIMNEDEHSISAYCIVFAHAKTGVEMEAMVGVCASLSTIYDLTKKYNPYSTIENIELIFKDGGENGLVLGSINKLPDNLKLYFMHNTQTFKDINVSILSVSERAVKGIYNDYSGEIIADYFKFKNGSILNKIVLPDDYYIIKSIVLNVLKKKRPELLVLTGGTGLAKDDVTNNVLSSICNKHIPGIGEFLRDNGSRHAQNAWLSSSFAGIYNTTLILSLPGNPAGVFEALNSLTDLLLHSLEVINKS